MHGNKKVKQKLAKHMFQRKAATGGWSMHLVYNLIEVVAGSFARHRTKLT